MPRTPTCLAGRSSPEADLPPLCWLDIRHIGQQSHEQVVVGFLGGETWQILSNLLSNLGLEIYDVDPKTYPELRFEKRINPDRGYIYLYSKGSDPEGQVTLESRIDANDECWGVGGGMRDQ